PELRIVGVQSSAAPGATRSWLDGEVRSLPSTTEAGGLATEYPGGLSLKVMLRLLETIVLVTEEDLWRAVGAAFRATGYPIELAGAAGFAALEEFPDELPGKRVGIIVTGGRISATDLVKALTL